MGWLTRLFGTGEDASKTTANRSKKNILDVLETAEGETALYEIIKTRSASEVESFLATFPFDELRLDSASVQSDFPHHKRFELITWFAEILVQYETIRTQRREKKLPSSFPAKRLGEVLLPRLMAFLRRQHEVDITHSLRIRLYELAMEFMRAERDAEALECLLVSRPSIKEDHDAWILGCRYNIAMTTKRKVDLTAAITDAENIISGKVNVPEAFKTGARQMLERLRSVNATG